MDGFSEKWKRVSRNSIFAFIKRLHRPISTIFKSILLALRKIFIGYGATKHAGITIIYGSSHYRNLPV